MKTIPLANGRGFARVDDADYELVSRFSWHAHRVPGNTYARAYIPQDGRQAYLHVLIMGQTGIDHCDGDGLNCQRSNMRPATRAQNGANQRPRGGRSRYKGVGWYKRDECWRAQIMVNYRNHHLGYFTDEIEAARAYDAAAREMQGEYARLNFP